jgi:hypothetical protein
MSGSKPFLNEENATAIVKGEIRSKDRAMVAVKTLSIIRPLKRFIPQKTKPKATDMKPKTMLLSNVNMTTELSSKRKA